LDVHTHLLPELTNEVATGPMSARVSSGAQLSRKWRIAGGRKGRYRLKGRVQLLNVDVVLCVGVDVLVQVQK